MTDPKPRLAFSPGTVVCTIGASEVATRAEMLTLLRRHLAGDWGDLGPEDKKANDDAVAWGDRILSSYHVKGEKLWVITEGDRSQTTVLTPGEY